MRLQGAVRQSVTVRLELVAAPAELKLRRHEYGLALHIVMGGMAGQASEPFLFVGGAEIRLMANGARLSNCHGTGSGKASNLVGIARLGMVRSRAVATFTSLL